jgi:hypothetical protein
MNPVIPSLPPPSWGERTSLLDKGLQYMFSMNLELELGEKNLGSNKAGLLAALTAPDSKKGYTFHVLDEVLARLGDGTVCNVPLGDVKSLNDKMLIGYDGAASLDGRIRLDIEGPLTIAYTGVATFAGGADRILKAALPPPQQPASPPHKVIGLTFVSMRTECPLPKYRWMVVNQLFGFGRVEVQHKPVKPGPGGCSLSFSYDVYAAGAEE